MSDELILSVQSNMQFLPTWLPIILLYRAEEQFPAFREKCYGPVCREKNYIMLFWGFV
jgi:hypothetical protein